MDDDKTDIRELVATVAAAYFSNSHVTPGDIPTVISQIASSLGAVSAPVSAREPETATTTPKRSPAQIRKSITPPALISFEDGKGYKTLRRHLTVKGLTPEGYREKWGLPRDYPMVAADYSAARSTIAKELGLGQKGPAARATRKTVARTKKV
jgi:predicted transcriptional regulator